MITPSGTSGPVTFTVVSLAPTLSSIVPSSSTVLQRGSNVTVALAGTNLTGATAVTVSGNGVTLSSFTVNSAISITAVFAISNNGTGTNNPHNVQVVTPAGTSNAVQFTKN